MSCDAKANIMLITKDEYEELMNDKLKLKALELVGVDGWERYDDAIEILGKWMKERNGV